MPWYCNGHQYVLIVLWLQVYFVIFLLLHVLVALTAF